MARVADYNKKIEVLRDKIEKRTEQLKALKAELKELEATVAQQNMQDIAMFIQDKKIDPAEVMNVLKEHFSD